MLFNQFLNFKINNLNFTFKNIVDSDVNKDYVDGLISENKYLLNNPKNISLDNQKRYIRKIIKSGRDSIFGLFIDQKLIGTAGIQFIRSIEFSDKISFLDKELAQIGIFIFSKDYRGLGLGKTLVWCSVYLINKCSDSTYFGAGMHISNVSSFKSFRSCGFKTLHKDNKNIKVVLQYKDLKNQNFINDLIIKSF